MAEFKRGANELIERLRTENLFQCKLLPDIEAGKVFFAIRDKYVSFYYKGGSLFKYDGNGFSTHYKYGFVPSDSEVTYITENDLHNMEIIEHFADGYARIKERVEKYASVEAEGVSALYAFAPRVATKGNRYFLVDIEVAFDAKDDLENQNDKGNGRTTDRIDILLYDNIEGELLFCEAKHFSNKEIWAGKNNKPRVIKQIKTYNRQIMAQKQAILEAYKKAFDEYNFLFGACLCAPKCVRDECGLLIFGFDTRQKEKINDLLIADGSLDGIKSRQIGDIFHNVRKTNTVQNLFSSLR